MRPRAAALFVLPLLASSLAANEIDTIRPDAPELSAFGPNGIGVTTLTVTNPGQIDVLNVTESDEPLYDRTLTLEVWYPSATTGSERGTYEVTLRDGERKALITGRAVRDAPPATG